MTAKRTFLQRHLATRRGYCASMALFVASFAGAVLRWPLEGLSALTAIVSLNALYYSCVMGYALAVRDLKAICPSGHGFCWTCRESHP